MFSKVQTFLGSTDGGVPNLFLYPDSLLKQGGVTKIYFMNLRKHEIKLWPLKIATGILDLTVHVKFNQNIAHTVKTPAGEPK